MAISIDGSPRGFDYSHWNRQPDPEEVAISMAFVMLKATQGSAYVDPTFRQRWAALWPYVNSGGLDGMMAYLFLEPGEVGPQVAKFCEVVGDPRAGLAAVVDFEAAGTNQTHATEAADQLVARGYPTIVYTAPWKLGSSVIPQLKDHWLLFADYSPPYVEPAGWENSKIWGVQFTDKGQAFGSVYDFDAFNGDAALLAAWFGTGGVEMDQPTFNKMLAAAFKIRDVENLEKLGQAAGALMDRADGREEAPTNPDRKKAFDYLKKLEGVPQ